MQETAALTVVDTFIRERLCNICQQEEDIETILGEVLRQILSINTINDVTILWTFINDDTTLYYPL